MRPFVFTMCLFWSTLGPCDNSVVEGLNYNFCQTLQNKAKRQDCLDERERFVRYVALTFADGLTRKVIQVANKRIPYEDNPLYGFVELHPSIEVSSESSVREETVPVWSDQNTYNLNDQNQIVLTGSKYSDITYFIRVEGYEPFRVTINFGDDVGAYVVFLRSETRSFSKFRDRFIYKKDIPEGDIHPLVGHLPL